MAFLKQPLRGECDRANNSNSAYRFPVFLLDLLSSFMRPQRNDFQSAVKSQSLQPLDIIPSESKAVFFPVLHRDTLNIFAHEYMLVMFVFDLIVQGNLNLKVPDILTAE